MYGIDAPRMLLILFIVGSAFLASGLYLVFRPIVISFLWNSLLAGFLIVSSVSFFRAVLWMLYSSLWQKSKVALRLLDWLEKLNGPTYWIGVEKVLDVGCGRGLLMNATAKRLIQNKKEGFKVCGIDIFSSKDLSSNTLKAARSTAKKEGIPEELIEIKKCDAREIEYEDRYFDLVVSSLTIHNVGKDSKSEEQARRVEREKALDEIIRVLNPGGSVIIWDLFNGEEYAEYFTKKGLDARMLEEFTSYSLKSSIIYARKCN